MGALRIAVASGVGVALSVVTAGCTGGASTTATHSRATVTSTVTATAPSGTATSSSEATRASATTAITATTATTTSGTTATTGACDFGALMPTLVTMGAGLGSMYDTIALRNAGESSCVLRGYPGVSMVGAGGRTIGNPAVRNAGQTPTTVTLRPGDRTTFDLRIVQALDYPANQCGRDTAEGLRIYPPGSRTAVFLRLAVMGCTRPEVTLMSVGPIGGTTPP